MKKYVIIVLVLLAATGTLFMLLQEERLSTDALDRKRELHKKFLAESPFAITKNLSKEERKKLSLPPNGYNEREWELTMNPNLGYPTPFKNGPLLVDEFIAKGSPGTSTSPWVERGPSNIGGRTRVLFYDPNDVGANNGDGIDYNRVFAAGISGGLWVNDNINSFNSTWTLVPGLASGLNVSAYAVDPNDSNIIYLGTGEQYTGGAAVGNGLYKSVDGGVTWQFVNINIAGPGDLGSDVALFLAGNFFINDIKVRDMNGVSEVYVGVGSTVYGSPNSNINSRLNILGTQNTGLYRSPDGGNNWGRVEDPDFVYNFSGFDFYVVPNDIEVSANNDLYMTTIGAGGIGRGGGSVFKSSNGIDWTLLQNIDNADRTQIAVSSTNPNKFYVLANVSTTRNGQTRGEADLFVTINDFTTLAPVNEPDDADNNIPSFDFTRNQAFYDLMLEVDPNNDNILYVGGINMHRTTNGGATWTQLSKWSNNRNMNLLNVPFIHADVHSLTFNPINSNSGLIGSDGGVSYASSFSNAATSTTAIRNRINNFNVTQFYHGAIAQTGFENGGDFIGGTQDNGTLVFNNASTASVSTAFDVNGGDGSFVAIDSEDGYCITGYTSRNHFYFKYPIAENTNIFQILSNGDGYEISDEEDGDFINVAELDVVYDVFYANSETSTPLPNGTTEQNSITACTLLPNSANCSELTSPQLADGRPTALKASPFALVTPTLFVGTEDSRVFRIDNAANNSTAIFSDISSNDFLGSVSDIEFGSSQNEIYVTFHNYGINNVWFTADGGITWSQKDGDLPDVPVKAILRNPLAPNEVIIGTEIGIFATSDFDSASPTWTQTINGMTSVKVVDLDLRTADNTVLATTHGRGMFTGKFDTTTASVSTVPARDRVKVYPTQARNEIFVQSAISLENLNIAIYNLNGQEVYRSSQPLTNARQQIDISTLSTGLYLIKMSGNGWDQTTKFVKE